MRIVITGGTGFIGHALVDALTRQQHDVVVLCRKPARSVHSSAVYVEWDARTVGPWRAELQEADAVVNLAGAPIAEGRWTPARKRLLLESRTVSTRLLVDALAARISPLPVFITASGIGYYGASDDRVLDEGSALGEGFLADLSAAWEAEALRAAQFRTRVVVLRTGMVLEEDGGALPKMLLPFRFFAGGPVLPGTQWVSWIHRADLIGLIQWAMTTPTVCGPLNAVAPEAVTMKTFCTTVGRVLHRPSWLPVPSLALQLALGELGTLMTTGQRVDPAKARAGGYAFRYPTLEPALRAIVGGERRP
ncbi:MAG: TIGR01777 family oxidoreductase [Nitrospira sp.]|nr:TIGR01777 family oxidoreductase [Nitrospira sp.]MCC7471113.1 TIGR01777 family oxidoreductase [Candidatus Nomurabacteria bacterium]